MRRPAPVPRWATTTTRRGGPERHGYVGYFGTQLAPFGASAGDPNRGWYSRLVLRPGGYEWEFVPEAGGSFMDAGSDVCH